MDVTTQCCICGATADVFSFSHKKTKDEKIVCRNCFKKAGVKGDYRKYTVEEIEQLTIEKNKHDSMISNFIITDNLNYGAKFNDDTKEMILGNYCGYVENEEYYDENYKRNPEQYELFSYSQIVDFELLENGESIASGGIERAAVGGLLFGGVGAVVGVASRSYKGVCSELKIKLTVKNYKEPAYYIYFITGDVKKNDYKYVRQFEKAHNTLSKFQLIVESMSNSENLNTDTSKDKFDEIRKYKSLLDDGIISQEEFEKKKAELLGL